jgi:hypothetical protein
MIERRDFFLLHPAPGRAEEARRALGNWLIELESQPGFLGGSVLDEFKKEIVPDAIMLTLRFETTHAFRAFWERVRGTGYCVEADGDDPNPPDQSAVLAAPPDSELHTGKDLVYDRGNGLFARLFHMHSLVEVDHVVQAPIKFDDTPVAAN